MAPNKFLKINRDPQQTHAVVSLEGNYLPLQSSQLPLPHPAQSSLVSLRLSETPTVSDTALAAQFSSLFLNEHAWKFPTAGTMRVLVKCICRCSDFNPLLWVDSSSPLSFVEILIPV